MNVPESPVGRTSQHVTRVTAKQRCVFADGDTAALEQVDSLFANPATLVARAC